MPGRRGDLLEPNVERVLQRDHLRLRRRQLCEAAAELAAESPTPQPRERDRRRGPARIVVEQRLGARGPARACAQSLQVLTTRRCSQVENCDSPRNWRIRTHELRERLLRGVARVLRVAQEMQRELLDARRVALAERRERLPVAVFRAASRGSGRRASRRRAAAVGRASAAASDGRCTERGCTDRLL